MKRYFIRTWGCQMNAHDTEKMAGVLAGRGYTAATRAPDADVILLNTCSVRAGAENKVFSELGRLRRLKQRNPGLVIGVCGCVAQQEGEMIFRRAPHVELVMGPRSIARLGDLLDEARRDGRSISLARDADPIAFPDGTAARGEGPRAWVTVMEGCNKSCTYCIVPFTRGREAYRPAAEILAEVAGLARAGYSEIELLGQNVNAWHQGPDDFAGLLRQVDRIPGVRRLRFTTSHPGHLKDAIIDGMAALPSVCNHLHLPAQSGSDRVLRAMDRGYTRSRYLSRIARLRERIADMAFSTDIIVGFPGETEGDFEETLSLLREVEFDQAYAFKFSPRPGTVAARLDDSVPAGEKETRLQRVLALQEEIQRRRHEALVGREFEVLIDGTGRIENGLLKGRTRCNRIVHIPPAGHRPGEYVHARIISAAAHSLQGAAGAAA
jgi:tRNA-2-methylthio-N6-dimethylallyladenosine synthase